VSRIQETTMVWWQTPPTDLVQHFDFSEQGIDNLNNYYIRYFYFLKDLAIYFKMISIFYSVHFICRVCSRDKPKADN
jgi:hypothetical protein